MRACVLNRFSCVQLFVTVWIVAHQAPLSMGFPRQEYWSGLPSLPPGDLPDPGIELVSPALQADSLPSEPPKKTLLKRRFRAHHGASKIGLISREGTREFIFNMPPK